MTNQEVISRLLTACPSFRTKWEGLLAEEGDDASELIYVTAGVFANHLLDLHQAGQTHEFRAVAQIIEEFHASNDPRVREFATIGILESVQNVWGNRGVDPEQFVHNLLPESAKWWCSLNKFWDGSIRYVGEDL